MRVAGLVKNLFELFKKIFSGFWGRDAKENSLIVFVFKEPIKLAKLRILSGGSDHPNDVLPLSTLIQSSPEQLVDDFRDQIHFDTLGSVDHSGNVNFGNF